MSEENKLIPQLRFPEFVNEGEWDEKKLGDIAENVMYGMNSAAIEYDGENKYIRITDIDENTRMFSPNPTSSPNGQLDDKYLLNKGDILFARTGASVGKSYIHKTDEGKIYFAGFLIRFSITGEVPYFVYAQTLTKQYQKWVTKTSMRSGQPGINAEEYKLYPICLPPTIQEQQKIASCLSSLDEVIAAHSQKLELLKEHKKGLMQNLFPQEGEKVPNYRFKEFEKDGEWVEKSLIDTADKKVKWSFTGGPFGSNLKASDYTNEGIRIIQLQNIGDGEFNDEYKIYTSEEKADELLSCNIYTGEIIISKMGDPVGRTCIIPDNLKRCVMASDGIRLVVNETKYSKYFVYSLINSKHIREAIENKATGSTRKRIGLDELRNVKLIMPKSLTEQTKIASCLSSLDELITAQAEKIEQLKLHKKGLMQGLFPKTIMN